MILSHVAEVLRPAPHLYLGLVVLVIFNAVRLVHSASNAVFISHFLAPRILVFVESAVGEDVISSPMTSVLSVKVALDELALARQAKCSSKVLNGIFLPLDV